MLITGAALRRAKRSPVALYSDVSLYSHVAVYSYVAVNS
jgi:hypothetical protein